MFDYANVRVASRELLLAHGARGSSLTAAVRAKQLVRARRDHYVLPTESPRLIEAIRIGGRMACVTALEDVGLFAVTDQHSHLHLDHTMSRLRSPQSRFTALNERNRIGAKLHWSPLFDDVRSTEYSTSIPDALAQVLRCQSEWLALASIDNALHKGAISGGDLKMIFANVPDRYHHLLESVDGRAEAGQETVLRMIIRSAGLQCEPQVEIARVGRVDLLVEGCLVVEADSRLAHDGWEKPVDDRRRDLQLAALGYMSLRPAYQHTMHQPQLVLSAIKGLLDQRQRLIVSGR